MSDQQYQWDAIAEHMADCKLFVETGSATGATSAWAADRFDHVWTIEFLEENYISVLQRFFYDDRVTCIRGDSATMLFHVEFMLHQPAVFWLDGHFDGGSRRRMAPSGVTPIMKELRVALNCDKGHVVLVDDARLFTGRDGYPTLDEVQAYAHSRSYTFDNRDDVLRMLPNG